MSERLDTLARRVMDARRDYDVKYKAKVKAEKARQTAERDLHEQLLKENQKKATLELGEGYGTQEFQRREKISASVFDKEAALAHFEERHMTEGYVEAKVRQGPLNQMVREALETGAELPPGVEPRTTKYVQVTKR